MSNLRLANLDSLKYYMLEYMEHTPACDCMEEKDKKWLANRLANFCLDSVDKYAKGKAEHLNDIANGRLSGRDCLAEMYPELMDLVIYHGMAVDQNPRPDYLP